MAKKKCTQCAGKMEGYDACSGSSVCSICYRANVREEQRKRLANETARLREEKPSIYPNVI